MKILVTLKDPDGFHECLEDAVKESLQATDLPEDERDALFETRCEKAWKILSTWVEYQEYVDIEFDTEARTATVKVRK